MSKFKIDFAFSRGDKVTIKELERPGVVTVLWYGDEGCMYNVRYFSGAVAKTVYFYADELEMKK